MIDYSSMEKFEAKIGFVDQELYIYPLYNKYHKELSQIADLTNVADIYTTKTSACYVHGEYIHIDTLLFKYEFTPTSIVDEAQLKTIIDEACQDLVEKQLTNEYLYPPNYVFVVNFIDIPVSSDEKLSEVRIRYAFRKVDDQPWPQH